MNSEIMNRALLWNNLVKNGAFTKLDIKIDQDEVLNQLIQFENNWCPYNVKKDIHNNRWGLPITSHSGDVMDNYHLNSFGYMQKYHDTLLQESDFTTPTEVYYKIPELKKLVDLFNPDIGRVHLLRVDKGGFFPPHRDFHELSPEYFRICCVFGNCSEHDFIQVLDHKTFYPEPANVYLINFQLSHSVISFTDGLYNLILTVKLNQRTHNIVLNHLV